MGRSLVKAVLSHGDCVCAVGRVFEGISENMFFPLSPPTTAADKPPVQRSRPQPSSSPPPGSPSAAAAAASAAASASFLPALCDVRAYDSVRRVVDLAAQKFGRVDVVANCAGYGVIAACEDQDEAEVHGQFETNFMGTLHVLQAAIPLFRTQGRGRFLIFSSTSGALGVPGLGPYCATKYAVEGLIEATLYETDAFGIKATLVEPGLVRRDEWNPADSPLPTFGHFLVKDTSGGAYSSPTAPALHARRLVQWLGDRQPTSAVKCAELVWQLGHCTYPPLRLLLGSYAIESIRDRLKSVTEELEDWKHLNFPVPGEAASAGASGGEASGKAGAKDAAADDRDEEMADSPGGD